MTAQLIFAWLMFNAALFALLPRQAVIDLRRKLIDRLKHGKTGR